MKLIQIKPEHFIVVDDSEIKEGDWVIDKHNTVYKQLTDKIFENFTGVKKITHSTQPLGFLQEEGITTANLKHDWGNVKQLSLSEVEEAIYGYSLEKMTEERLRKCNGVYAGYKQLYLDGFKAHQELVKDKLFTVEDMRKALSVVYRDWYQDTGHSENTEDEYLDRIIQSLLPKTEWEVEIIDGKLKLK